MKIYIICVFRRGSGMGFSIKDAEVIRKYRAFRAEIWDVLGSLGKEILESYEVQWDGINYEQRDYFFLRFIAGNKELSPGVKVTEEYIVQPVFWATEAALKGVSSKLGFKKDPEFKGYLIRELDLGKEFFSESLEAQKETILKFFREVLGELEEEGIISSIRSPEYHFAG